MKEEMQRKVSTNVLLWLFIILVILVTVQNIFIINIWMYQLSEREKLEVEMSELQLKIIENNKKSACLKKQFNTIMK